MTSALESTGCLKLVIFDCDGVLVDSEGPSCRAIAQFARSIGLSVTDEESHARYVGKALPLVAKELERDVGHALPDDTAAKLRDTLIRIMEKEAEPVSGAPDMLADLRAIGLPSRVGSNSSLQEMDMKFQRTGMTNIFPPDRIHSGVEVAHPKPEPDVYLAAARAEGVQSEECVVIEDSDTGAEAAYRAGMACILLRGEDAPPPDFWPAPGFVRIGHLSELAPLLRQALDSQKSRCMEPV